MDIKKQIEILKEQLQQSSDFETDERKAARERLLAKIETISKEFELVANFMGGTTPEQITALSQLRKIILKLGNSEGSEI